METIFVVTISFISCTLGLVLFFMLILSIAPALADLQVVNSNFFLSSTFHFMGSLRRSGGGKMDNVVIYVVLFMMLMMNISQKRTILTIDSSPIS
jgi:hypothetical protein